MAYRGVWLIFSLLVFCCCGLLANGGEIKLDFKITNRLPISTIKIGSIEYKLLLGTWYSNFWIFSKSACEDKKREAKKLKDDPVAKANLAMCQNVVTYDDTSLSESDKITKFDVPYLNGKLKGYLIKENIEIGGHALQQSIGIVTDWPPRISDNNKNGGFDGHFGLMFLQKKDSFFFKLLESKTISSKHFGIYFNPDHNSGRVIFGGNDDKRTAGGVEPFKDVQILSAETGWLINIDSAIILSTWLHQGGGLQVQTSNSEGIGKHQYTNITNIPINFLQKSVTCIPGRLRKFVDNIGAYVEI